MIILITGTTHTGKTILAQKLLTKYHYPYISMDHLKMGLIRSNQTNLTPEDDEFLTPYLWNITSEIIKTAIENKQNLIVEGCYIPFDWQDSFDNDYLKQIKYYCLVMSEKYIQENFSKILDCASIIEDRGDSDFSLSMNYLIKNNIYNLTQCKQMGLNYLLIDDSYDISIDLD